MMVLFEEQGKKYLKDLQVGDKLKKFYSRIISKTKKTKRDGEPYLALQLMDKTGKMEAKIWDEVESYIKLLKDGEIYKISGFVNEYRNTREIKIDLIENVSTDDQDYQPEDFQERADFDTEQLFNEMIIILESNIKNEFLLRLIKLFSATYKEQFKEHYGAQKIHHNYAGGLLEHTYSVIKLAVLMADHYALNKEILLIGALFHDIGKLSEFTHQPGIETTLEGGLIGHIIIGNNIFITMKNKIKNFPEDLNLKIQHLIISHHGEREFGAPEIPKTPEALVLHILDLLDSKLKIFSQTINKSDSNQLFSEYLPILGRRIHIPKE